MNQSAKEAKGHILILSRDPDLQAACRQALGPGNFSCQSAPAPPEWVCAPEGGDIDIVLLDAAILLDQPEVDLLANLRVKDPDLVCILLSERSAMDRALQAIRAGAYDVVFLPVVPELLSLRVTRGLERRMSSLKLKRLQTFEKDVSRLWSVAKGELGASELFDKDFLAPAAFRLTVAHEFRAPLTALQSFLLILLKGYVAPEMWKEMIQHALDRSQDLLNLVDDLMNLAIARQEMSLATRAFLRLGDELEKVIPTLKAEADEKGLTLTLAIHQNPTVEVNPLHMRQLWINLISNAIKYTPGGGQIRVALDQNELCAIGTIADTGIGIAPHEVVLIFNEFFRTPEAKKMERRGTGLGLPLVKRIVEGYGGRVEVESTPGKGSLFRFTLPVAVLPSSKDPIGEGGTP